MASGPGAQGEPVSRRLVQPRDGMGGLAIVGNSLVRDGVAPIPTSLNIRVVVRESQPRYDIVVCLLNCFPRDDDLAVTLPRHYYRFPRSGRTALGRYGRNVADAGSQHEGKH